MFSSSSKELLNEEKDNWIMLATIRDYMRNVLNGQHINPNSKRSWKYSDIPIGVNWTLPTTTPPAPPCTPTPAHHAILKGKAKNVRNISQ